MIKIVSELVLSKGNCLGSKMWLLKERKTVVQNNISPRFPLPADSITISKSLSIFTVP